MSIQFPAVQDTIVAILVIVAIAAALSVAFGVAASFYLRSKNRHARRPGSTTTTTTTVAPIEHPTRTDGPIGTGSTRELVLR